MRRIFTDIENSGLAYVYEHWRPDKNQCFWVGKGTRTRYRIYKRNPHYNNIVAKLRKAGLKLEVRFVATDLSDEDAYEIEIERMAFWKEQGVILTNTATGGRGGMSGIPRSVESREKQSKTTSGRKLSPKHAAAIAERNRTPERREAVRLLHTGRKRPPETGAKIRAAMIAIGHKPPGNKGRKTSEETKAKQSAAKTPEIRAALSAKTTAAWQEPGERERRSAAMSISNTGRIVTASAKESLSKALTPERQAVMQEASRQMKEDPERRQAWIDALSASRPEKLSPSHIESLKRSWTPERKKSVAEKVRITKAAKRAQIT